MIQEQFILVAVKGTMHRPIVEGVMSFVQSQRTKLKGDWIGWKLQVRRKSAYKNKPILNK